MEGIGKALAPIILVILAIALVYNIGKEVPAWAWLTLLIVAALGFALFMFRKEEAYSAAPIDGPMQVNTTIQSISPKKHRLHVNVVMSHRDRIAFKNSGLMENEIFPHPHPTFPERQVSFTGHHLFNTKYVDFPTMPDAIEAKDILIDSLRALRTRLDQMRESGGKTTEQLEI